MGPGAKGGENGRVDDGVLSGAVSQGIDYSWPDKDDHKAAEGQKGGAGAEEKEQCAECFELVPKSHLINCEKCHCLVHPACTEYDTDKVRHLCKQCHREKFAKSPLTNQDWMESSSSDNTGGEAEPAGTDPAAAKTGGPSEAEGEGGAPQGGEDEAEPQENTRGGVVTPQKKKKQAQASEDTVQRPEQTVSPAKTRSHSTQASKGTREE